MLHKRFDFTKLGGFPLTQNRLAYMQEAYSELIGAICSTFGDVIVSGCNISDGNISDGWMIIGGELLPFKSAPQQTYVKIVDETTDLTYNDSNVYPSQVLRYATPSAVVTSYTFSSFKRFSNKLADVQQQFYNQDGGINRTGQIGNVTCAFNFLRILNKYIQISGKLNFTDVNLENGDLFIDLRQLDPQPPEDISSLNSGVIYTICKQTDSNSTTYIPVAITLSQTYLVISGIPLYSELYGFELNFTGIFKLY